MEITTGLDETIEAMRDATRAFVNGDTTKWLALCSRESDATFEELGRYGSGELACTVQLEHYSTYVPEQDEPATMTLRVTHVYRLEGGHWRLLHRHGDHAADVWVEGPARRDGP